MQHNTSVLSEHDQQPATNGLTPKPGQPLQVQVPATDGLTPKPGRPLQVQVPATDGLTPKPQRPVPLQVQVPATNDLMPMLQQAQGPSLTLKLITLATVTIPLAGLVVAIVLLWGIAFNWIYLALLAGMYVASAGGITVGFHRLFTHRSFKTPRPVVALLAVFGSMAVEGPVLEWVATHRRHHQYSDSHNDPHSPHMHGGGVLGMLKGMWHSHTGWLFTNHQTNLAKYAPDLTKDSIIRIANKLFPLWVLLGLLFPAVVAGLVTMSWTGVLLGFLWGGLVRVFLVHHVTWSVNSVCHIWGAQPFESHDESRNNPIVGVLALGEGWHNNHHAFPTSARHGLQWWQIDFSYIFIRCLALVGLASDIRVPSRDRMESKKRH